MLRVAPALAEEIDVVRELIAEYGASLEIDLSYQNFQEEVASLPGRYGSPGGQLLLGRVGGAPAGCVALRRLDLRRCEMKRLYVRPEHRGAGLGRLLVEAAIEHARVLGYVEMLLDTLATMTGAHELYFRLGFREIAPYTQRFAPGSRFFALRLDT
jgi:GNAT superfamily N-acetyltransferase